MKRCKLVITKPTGRNRILIGREAELVDMDTGERVSCVQDLQLNMPLKCMITVTATIVISDIEIKEREPSAVPLVHQSAPGVEVRP